MTLEKTDDGKDNNNDRDDIEDKRRKDANKVKRKRIVDPFFISDDNDPVYLDIPVENNEDKKGQAGDRGKMGRNERNDFGKERRNNRNDFGRERRNDKFNNNSGNKFNRDNKFGKDSKFGRDRNKFNNDKSKFGDNKFNKGKINESRYGNKSNDFKKERNSFKEDKNENIAELHPSWAARKKQQDALKQGFQGKKIVFNDDD
ncbi:Protein of unknown function [Cotesia congregata]|uniref:Bud22 domain-containing protein n=1 Tax=Cotesia congregata TaxID=51543 RepID=A0A8J2MVX6_COTCN|nr:Protein of unknown function [Cotesia congregata]